MIEEKDIKVRMRDGVEIGLRIYRPDKNGTDTIHHNAQYPSEPMLPALDD